MEDGSVVLKFPIRNDVRNAKNGTRSLTKAEDVVFTTPNAGGGHFPFMPVGFPSGLCRIMFVKLSRDPYTAPYYMGTDAEQDVEEWSLDPDGSYGNPTGRKVRDGGYGGHASSSSTTLGCLKFLLTENVVTVAEKALQILVANGYRTKEEILAGKWPSAEEIAKGTFPMIEVIG